MNPRVCAVTPLPGLLLDLEFADGCHARFDIAPYVHAPAFARLRDPGYFSQAAVNHGTVEWPGGIDCDPDTLYLDSQNI